MPRFHLLAICLVLTTAFLIFRLCGGERHPRSKHGPSRLLRALSSLRGEQLAARRLGGVALERVAFVAWARNKRGKTPNVRCRVVGRRIKRRSARFLQLSESGMFDCDIRHTASV